jgi:hypothetical protein
LIGREAWEIAQQSFFQLTAPSGAIVAVNQGIRRSKRLLDSRRRWSVFREGMIPDDASACCGRSGRLNGFKSRSTLRAIQLPRSTAGVSRRSRSGPERRPTRTGSSSSKA